MGSPIEAPAAGVVTDAGWETGYGNTVTIDHGYGIVTKFAHALEAAGAGPASGSRAASASRWWATRASPPVRTSTTRCT